MEAGADAWGWRAAVAAPQIVLAGIVGVTGALGPVIAAALVVDVAVQTLPWPRDFRDAGTRIVVLHAAATTLPLATLLVILLAAGADAVTALPDYAWWVAAAAAGIVLFAISRVNVIALVRGDLAFLRGPEPPVRPTARAWALVVGAAGEEATYRGGILVAGSPPVDVLSTIAFVLHHHLDPRGRSRWRKQFLAQETTAAIVFSLLALGSGSILVPLASHLVANAPRFLLEIQVAVASVRSR